LSEKAVVVGRSHRLAEVEQIADKITVLRDGRTVGTSERGKMDRTGIVRLMLGKELTQTDVRRPQRTRDRAVLSVRHLCRRGVLNDVSLELHECEILGSHRVLTVSRGRIVGEMESHKASMQEIILSATGI
jgi:ABC-type sugar transport system ATPase subunit